MNNKLSPSGIFAEFLKEVDENKILKDDEYVLAIKHEVSAHINIIRNVKAIHN